MFDHRQELLGRLVGQSLHNPGRPFDPHEIDIRGVAQAEVGAKAVLAANTLTAGDLAQLPSIRTANHRLHTNLRADAGAIGNYADQFNAHPTIAVPVVPVEKVSLVFIVARASVAAIPHEEVQKPVVVVVTPGAAQRFSTVVGRAAGGNLGEAAIAIVVVEKVVLGAVV